MPTTTTTYSFNKPVVGADEDDWGGYLNGNWDSVDDLLDGTTPVTGIDINSGTLDGVTIGGTTAGAGTFTTLTATTSITGTLATAAQTNITSVGTLTSLDVGGTVTADGLTVDNGTSGQSKITISEGGVDNRNLVLYSPATGGTNGKIAIEGTTANLDFVVNNGSQTAIRIGGSTGDISFYEDTGTTAKFFWDASAESLGIGTTSPSNPLHVTNSSSTVSTGYFSNTSIGGDSPALIAQGGANNAGTVGVFEVRDYGGNTDFYVGGTGNVGIGTSSPSHNLHVLSSGGSTLALTAGSTENAQVRFGDSSDDDAGKINYDNSTNHMAFHTNAAERMRIDSSGNVGIGTSSPAGYKLHVADGTPTVRISGTAETAGLSQYITFGTPSYNRASIQSTNVGTQGADLKFLTAPSGGNTIERMRIDSSGNLLVGKTSDTYSVAGASIRANPSGVLSGATVTRDGANVVSLNRLTSDGDILTFSKDTTTVGSIGTEGGSGFDAMYIANGDAGLIFQGYANDAIIPFNGSTLDKRDAAIDLGYSSGRFKDLYLSGGVYLGGTGAANKLDDYEEGTWTPTIEGFTTTGTATYSQRSGRYTKIGNTVFIRLQLAWTNATGTGIMQLTGLPFTPSYADGGGAYAHRFNGLSTNSGTILQMYAAANVSYIRFEEIGTSGTPTAKNVVSQGGLSVSMSYEV